MKVAVAGAGIGGLSLALSLHAAGLTDITLFEAAPEIRPVGVGINLLPHAVRELTELGLDARIAPRAVATQALVYANRHGQEIWREPRGRFAGYGWPQLSIHRGVLQAILHEAVIERLGPDAVRTAAPAAAAEPGGLRLADGRRVEADLVVGADGVHSAVRAAWFPDEGPPKWNRRILWRGVSDAPPYLGGATMVMAGHQDQKFVCYPILGPDGRPLINWIAELAFPPDHAFRREDWNRAGRREDFAPRFADWRFDWLDVPGVIAAAQRIYEYPMVDRDPLERWTHGAATLLGDAAHAMYPIGSNGASQAILDARTLAFELATQPTVAAALAAYEAARRPATTRLVLLNRANGPEQVMQLAHERAPGGFAQVHDVLSAQELEDTAGAYKRAAGFDRETLNARPSLTPPPLP